VPERSLLLGDSSTIPGVPMEPRLVTGLDWNPESLDECIVGDSGNDVYVVDLSLAPGVVTEPDAGEGGDEQEEAVAGLKRPDARVPEPTAVTPQQIVEGQSASVFGVAVHPYQSSLVATACEVRNK
jgi:hypothetical protein